MVCRAEVFVPSAIFARLTSISCENGSRRCAGVAIHPPTDATAPRGLRRLSSLYGTAPRRSTDLGKRAQSDPCSSGVDPCTAPVDRAGSSPVGGAGRHRRASATSAFCRFQQIVVTTKLDRCSRASAFRTRCSKLLRERRPVCVSRSSFAQFHLRFALARARCHVSAPPAALRSPPLPVYGPTCPPRFAPAPRATWLSLPDSRFIAPRRTALCNASSAALCPSGNEMRLP